MLGDIPLLPNTPPWWGDQFRKEQEQLLSFTSIVLKINKTKVTSVSFPFLCQTLCFLENSDVKLTMHLGYLI
jgi:hypothetical protein